jgi:hypothetical protein
MDQELTDQLLALKGVDGTAVINEEAKIIDVFFKDEAIPLEQVNEVARLLSCYGYSSIAIEYDPTVNKVILSAQPKLDQGGIVHGT